MKLHILAFVFLFAPLGGAFAEEGHQEIKVEVPSSLWKMQVSEAFSKKNTLWVVCKVESDDGFGLTAIQTLKQKIKLEKKYAAMERKILVVGASWNWEKGYKRVSQEELAELKKGAVAVSLAKPEE